MKKICGDCLHYNACAAWNIGSLANTEAGGCVNFEHYHLYKTDEVIRCKDCEFNADDYRCPFREAGWVYDPNRYCSFGKCTEDEG